MSKEEEKGLVPNSDVVQRRTMSYAPDNSLTSYQNPNHPLPLPHKRPTRERREVMIAFRITRSLVERIEQYQVKYRKKGRTDAIIELLETALYIMENVRRLDDPALVKYFRENLYNVQVVDDVMDWPQDRVDAMLGMLASERDRRIRLKIGRF